jgi:pimeloyl-ACP methyl ester carboxylesterase
MNFNVDGRNVFAADGGREHRAGQAALVLIHGSGVNHTVWEQQNRFLANHGVNVFSIDLPGHGRSQGPALTDVGQMSDWLSAFLASAGLSSSTVLGHSLGALVAIHFAASHPQQCDGVIVAGVTARMAVNPALLNAAKENDPKAFELIVAWSHASAPRSDGQPVPDHSLSSAARRLLESERECVLYTDLNACNEYADAQQKFAKLTVPVTVIAAAEDKMTPAKAVRELASGLEGAILVVIQGAGHNMMLERPSEFNNAVRKPLGV